MISVAFICDRGAISPTALALWSALSTASAPLEAIVVGLGLEAADWDRLAEVVSGFAGARLRRIDFDPGRLGAAGAVSGHISRATFARLFLHQLADGRVLYLDGDILVTGDLCKIAAVSLDRDLIAAVPDFVAQKWCARLHGPRRAEARRKLVRWGAYSGDPAQYFNAGVVLMDMAAIRADRAIAASLEDVGRAATYPLADQDHLNRVFAGRARLLGPEWNCSWGRIAAQRRFMAAAGLPVPPPADPIVLHFHGPAKPWKRAAWRRPLWQWPQVLRYRRALRAFNRRFPGLAF